MEGNFSTRCLNRDEKDLILREFESRCAAMKHFRCNECHSVGICMKVSNKGLCKNCANNDKGYLLKTNTLPLWKDGRGRIHYDVPRELKCLTIAEKLLIQLASVVVPLQHIKNGVFGLLGHVCAFEQDVNEFAKVLPRR